MKRNDWEFKFTVKELEEAAREQVDYHNERENWWQAEKNTAEEKLKASMELRTMQVSGGERLDAVFDQQIQNRVSECANKVNEHRNTAASYSNWVFAFQKMTGKVSLNADDILYFFKI